ncbi:hypothetical protein CsSME_00011096 [Camellia sinensis var. sinensis]
MTEEGCNGSTGLCFSDPGNRRRKDDDAKVYSQIALGSHPPSFFPDVALQEFKNGYPSAGLADSLLWSQNITSKQSSITAPLDSQSLICVSSPYSTTKPKGRDNQATGATSGSSHEQSDDDDLEIEKFYQLCLLSTS